MIDGARLLFSVFKLRIGVAIMLCALAGASAGGALFLRGSLRLARDPCRRSAMANFRASLAQLGLLLLGALADAAF